MKLGFKEIVTESFWGIIARVINPFVPIDEKKWVFSSDYGHQYREGSKYLIEYMLSEHPEYHVVFVTRNSQVLHELQNKNIPCVHNFSWKGVFTIARAKNIFFTQYCDDIYFAYRKKGRNYFYLLHGMPGKRTFLATPIEFKKKYNRHIGIVRQYMAMVRQWLVLAFTIEDVKMLAICSDFNLPYIKACFGNDLNYPILGMPRNDALFQPERMVNEKWINTQGKFVVTYMPTHRAYGNGDPTPTPFITRQDIQAWFQQNNIVFVMKNHPNMADKVKANESNTVIVDITKDGIDPQVALYHSDVLITDYSSVWMDYILLRRPILLYFYDNYENDDEGTLFKIEDVCPSHSAKTEDELFHLIQKCYKNYDAMRPTEDNVYKFHKYVDGNSCQRHFEYIKSLC